MYTMLCIPGFLGPERLSGVPGPRAFRKCTDGFSFGLEAATAPLAAARLARLAAEVVVVPCKAEALTAAFTSRPSWGSGSCPLGYGKSDSSRYPKVGNLAP